MRSEAASLAGQSLALAYQGEAGAARAAADAAVEAARRAWRDLRGHRLLGVGCRGPGRRRWLRRRSEAREAARQHMSVLPRRRRRCSASGMPQAALAGGDLAAARRWADEAVSTTTGWFLMRGADDARPGGDRAG